ncbi:MAG: GDP-mannose 4,6-dehydratase [Acidobacteria bacterium]|jgi:GDP-4-dehydro-6-deoxy-D-mannose reductase|nr:GDP-mannose 4,6-dehydratase [Acidobacteriota bacterium]
MSRILVTGCSGFLASHLLRLLLREERNKVFGITEVPGFIYPDVEVFQVDIRRRDDIAQMLEIIRPDITFHLAAVTNVGFAWKNPELTYEVNFMGTSHLLEALQATAPDSRLLLMSSAEVYQASSGDPIRESSPTACQNPYALSKMAMEMLGDLYWRVFGMKAFKLRAFNFTGPGQDSTFVASDFASQIARIERGELPPVIRVGNLDAVRDFSDVRDVARYVQVIGARGEGGELFNVCSGAAHSIRRLLDVLLAQARVPIRVEVDPARFRPLDNPVLSGDPTRMQRRFGLAPQYPFERTLGDLLDYWREARPEDPGR